ncbi:hypothetical protein VTI28DRAFT_10614 [Corynascus sepedonium]
MKTPACTDTEPKIQVDIAGNAKCQASQQVDTRAQPWKKFVAVPDETKVITFGRDETVRMIASRVDGKNLGG